MILKQINAHLSVLAMAAMFSQAAFADPLALKTLVVYVSNSPDSASVKYYYISVGAITNSLPIAVLDIAAVEQHLPEPNASTNGFTGGK